MTCDVGIDQTSWFEPADKLGIKISNTSAIWTSSMLFLFKEEKLDGEKGRHLDADIFSFTEKIVQVMH